MNNVFEFKKPRSRDLTMEYLEICSKCPTVDKATNDCINFLNKIKNSLTLDEAFSIMNYRRMPDKLLKEVNLIIEECVHTYNDIVTKNRIRLGLSIDENK